MRTLYPCGLWHLRKEEVGRDSRLSSCNNALGRQYPFLSLVVHVRNAARTCLVLSYRIPSCDIDQDLTTESMQVSLVLGIIYRCGHLGVKYHREECRDDWP